MPKISISSTTTTLDAGLGDRIFTVKLHTVITAQHIKVNSCYYSDCRDPLEHQMLKVSKIWYCHEIYTMHNVKRISQIELLRQNLTYLPWSSTEPQDHLNITLSPDLHRYVTFQYNWLNGSSSKLTWKVWPKQRNISSNKSPDPHDLEHTNQQVVLKEAWKPSTIN